LARPVSVRRLCPEPDSSVDRYWWRSAIPGNAHSHALRPRQRRPPSSPQGDNRL